MQSPVKILVSTFLLTLVIAAAYPASSSLKLRRDGQLTLYPFPRVGRSSKLSWQAPINNFYMGYPDEYEPISHKREMIPFPRIGRRSEGSLIKDVYSDTMTPAQRSDGPGMWFGPRLGRSFKFSEDDIGMHRDDIYRSDPELMESTLFEERKKRQAKPN